MKRENGIENSSEAYLYLEHNGWSKNTFCSNMALDATTAVVISSTLFGSFVVLWILTICLCECRSKQGSARKQSYQPASLRDRQDSQRSRKSTALSTTREDTSLVWAKTEGQVWQAWERGTTVYCSIHWVSITARRVLSQPVFPGKPEGSFRLSCTFIFRNERNWIKESARVSEKLVSPDLPGLQVAMRLIASTLSVLWKIWATPRAPSSALTFYDKQNKWSFIYGFSATGLIQFHWLSKWLTICCSCFCFQNSRRESDIADIDELAFFSVEYKLASKISKEQNNCLGDSQRLINWNQFGSK